MTTSESYLHASRQYFVACKGLIHLYVTMTIHTAHAQKHFSPETKSKVRPKKNSPGPVIQVDVTILCIIMYWAP